VSAFRLPFVDTGAVAAVASAISTSSSSSLSSDSEPESEADSSLSDEPSFLFLATPGSGSEDSSSSESDSLPESADLGIGFETGLDGAPSELSSEDSSLELSSGLAVVFADELLVVGAGTFAGMVFFCRFRGGSSLSRSLRCYELSRGVFVSGRLLL